MAVAVLPANRSASMPYAKDNAQTSSSVAVRGAFSDHGLAALAALVIEAAMLVIITTGRINPMMFLGAHAIVVILLGVRAVTVGHRGGNTLSPMLTLIAVAATGPIGAAGTLLLMQLASRPRQDQALLSAWYERIALSIDVDDVTLLCDAVATGRTPDLATVTDRSFATVMQSGNLADRQTALGIIARKFHPDYLPALLLALKSPEPIIRVQAAAVATRIRPLLRARVDKAATSAESVTGDSIATLAADMKMCAASGLLDESDRLRADVVEKLLLKRAAATTVTDTAAWRRFVPSSPLQRDVSEGQLLSLGQFKALRVSRRLTRLLGHGLYSIRRPETGSSRRLL